MDGIGFESGQELTRKDIDNLSKRADYKQRQFKGKRSAEDGYTGKRIFTSARGEGVGRTKPRFHSTSTTANVDHVVPLKQLIKRYEKLVPEEDIERIANSDYNLVVTNEALNKAKGGKNNVEYLLKQLEKQDPEDAATTLRMIAEQLKAETCIAGEITIYLTKHSGKLFLSGAAESLAVSAVPLTVRATQDLVKVAHGEMTMEEATKEITALGASIAVVGGTKKIATEALGEVLRNLAEQDNEIARRLLEFAGSNQFGPAMVVVSSITRATGKYLSGEISGEALFQEIAQDSITQIAGMLASTEVIAFLGLSGGPATAAAVITAMLVSAVCTTICEGVAALQQETKTNREIQRVADEAAHAIRLQQEELRELIGKDRQEWLATMNDVFQTIAAGIMSDDLQKTNQGLMELMSTYNRTVHLYQSGDEVMQGLLDMRTGKAKKLI